MAFGAASPRECAKLYNISYRTMRKLIDAGAVTPRRVTGSVRSLVLFSDLERVISTMPPTTRRRSTQAISGEAHATA